MRRPSISCIIFYIQFQTEYDKVHLLGGEKLGYDPKKKALILGKPGKTNHRVLDKENKYCYALISYQKYVPLLT